MRTGIAILLMTTALAAMPSAASAQSGDVVMRRPIPRLDGGTGGPVVVAPPSQEDGVPNPATDICDASTAPYISNTAWIEKGWKAAGENMCGSEMTYACQATYTCSVAGSTDTFTSEAPDSVCEDYDGTVEYPTASNPQTANANAFLEAGRRAYTATSAMMPTPAGSADIGLDSYDFGDKGSDSGPQFTGIVQSYFAHVNDDDTCLSINKAVGVDGIPSYDPVGLPESCGKYITGGLYYMKRIDNAQASRQASYIMSLGALAATKAKAGTSTASIATLGMDGVERYNLITGMGLDAAPNSNKIYWLTIANPATCAEIDRRVNPGRTTTSLAPYAPTTLEEGCGTYGVTGAKYYWKRIGQNAYPDFTCTGAYQLQSMSGVKTIMVEGQLATVMPSKMCWGADLKAPKGVRHLLLQQDNNFVVYNTAATNAAAWSTGTQYAGTKMLAMASDGNLAAYDASSTIRWQSNTRGNPGAYAAFVSTGNIVVMSAAGQQIWQSNSATYDEENVAESTKTNAAGLAGAVVPYKLNKRQYVLSPNGKHKLAMQSDENLVLYVNGGAKWSAGTQYAGASVLVTRTDGVVQLLNPSGGVKWTPGATGVAGARMQIQDNGNMALIAPDGVIQWQTNTGVK